MTRAHTLSIQQPLAFAASGRGASDRTPAARAARSSSLNFALGALVMVLAASYFAGYLATVLAVGDIERAGDQLTLVAAELGAAERGAAPGGSLSYGAAAAAGLAEVAPRFVSAAATPDALSMNVR